MSKATIQNWTGAEVLVKFDQYQAVEYQVYREGETHFLDVRDAACNPIHTLELPDGMKLDKSSYEVLLRYVLLDIVAA